MLSTVQNNAYRRVVVSALKTQGRHSGSTALSATHLKQDYLPNCCNEITPNLKEWRRLNVDPFINFPAKERNAWVDHKINKEYGSIGMARFPYGWDYGPHKAHAYGRAPIRSSITGMDGFILAYARAIVTHPHYVKRMFWNLLKISLVAYWCYRLRVRVDDSHRIQKHVYLSGDFKKYGGFWQALYANQDNPEYDQLFHFGKNYWQFAYDPSETRLGTILWPPEWANIRLWPGWRWFSCWGFFTKLWYRPERWCTVGGTEWRIDPQTGRYKLTSVNMWFPFYYFM